MIIPMVCFTCGCPIAHHWRLYSELVKYYGEKIDFANRIQPQDLEKIINPAFVGQQTINWNLLKKLEEVPSATFLALAHIKMDRECCRRMFLGHQDMYEKIK
jgi:DNA-directed RNA polymerase subunit N (RpoN/RPB10)